MRKKQSTEQLTPLELEIMKVLWETGPAPVQTVQERLARRAARSPTTRSRPCSTCSTARARCGASCTPAPTIYEPAVSRAAGGGAGGRRPGGPDVRRLGREPGPEPGRDAPPDPGDAGPAVRPARKSPRRTAPRRLPMKSIDGLVLTFLANALWQIPVLLAAGPSGRGSCAAGLRGTATPSGSACWRRASCCPRRACCRGSRRRAPPSPAGPPPSPAGRGAGRLARLGAARRAPAAGIPGGLARFVVLLYGLSLAAHGIRLARAWRWTERLARSARAVPVRRFRSGRLHRGAVPGGLRAGTGPALLLRRGGRPRDPRSAPAGDPAPSRLPGARAARAPHRGAGPRDGPHPPPRLPAQPARRALAPPGRLPSRHALAAPPARRDPRDGLRRGRGRAADRSPDLRPVSPLHGVHPRRLLPAGVHPRRSRRRPSGGAYATTAGCRTPPGRAAGARPLGLAALLLAAAGLTAAGLAFDTPRTAGAAAGDLSPFVGVWTGEYSPEPGVTLPASELVIQEAGGSPEVSSHLVPPPPPGGRHGQDRPGAPARPRPAHHRPHPALPHPGRDAVPPGRPEGEGRARPGLRAPRRRTRGGCARSGARSKGATTSRRHPRRPSSSARAERPEWALVSQGPRGLQGLQGSRRRRGRSSMPAVSLLSLCPWSPCLRLPGRGNGSGRRDSNPRPTAWKAVTLPLSYSRRR